MVLVITDLPGSALQGCPNPCLPPPLSLPTLRDNGHFWEGGHPSWPFVHLLFEEEGLSGWTLSTAVPPPDSALPTTDTTCAWAGDPALPRSVLDVFLLNVESLSKDFEQHLPTIRV